MLNLSNISLKPVLKDLDLELKKGEFVVVIGANGAGKSTLLNLISGNLTPTQGKIILDGEDITSISAANRSSAIAKVSQDPKVGTMTNMTIYENLAFAALRGKRRGLGFFRRHRDKKLFKSKLAMLNMGLENRLNDLVGNLSGGQRQALSLIMAVLSESKILLLDEITAALDPNTAENIMKIADQIMRSEQRTAIMITHNMKHALEYGDRTLLLANGKFSKEFNKPHRQELTPSVLAAEFC